MDIKSTTHVVLLTDIKTGRKFTMAIKEKMETWHKQTKSYVFNIKRSSEFLILSTFNVNLIIVIIYTNNWTKNLMHPICVSFNKQTCIKLEHVTD